MSRVSKYLFSSIGKKQLMAITGLLWCGFVFTHMLGNLLTLVSADAYNSYGHKIVSNPALPLAEILLVLTFVLHVVFAIWVSVENARARPQAYYVAPNGKGAASSSSKTMKYSGMLILVFLILHILKFKYGTYYSTQVAGEEIRDLYRLMKEVFAMPIYTAWYLFCLLVLGMHLQHALASALNTFGVAKECTLKKMSCAFAFVVSVGFAINPILFFLRR